MPDRPHRLPPAARAAAVLGVIRAAGGLFLTWTGSPDLGHSVIGGAVIDSCLLAAWRYRRNGR